MIVLALLAQASAEWPTYHGGYRLDGVAETAPPDQPVRLWRYEAGDRIDSAPVSAAQRIFFTTAKGALVALDWNGRRLWKVEIAGEFFSSPPMVADGRIVVGASDGSLHAYDAADGRERWKVPVGSTILGSANRIDLPGGRAGIIVISQSDGAIHCLEPETGKQIWVTEGVERCDGSAGFGGGRIVMGSCASALHCFSAENGRKQADIDLGEDGQVAGGVAVSGTFAFAGTRGGRLLAADLAAGKLAWANEDAAREVFTTPAVNDALVVFASDDGKVRALNRGTGARVWEFDAGAKPGSPAIAANRAVVAAGGSLHLLELQTGRQVWTTRVADQVTGPALVGGRLIVGADDGTVSAFGR
jgi:outer membrane protein assembly factor BamB